MKKLNLLLMCLMVSQGTTPAAAEAVETEAVAPVATMEPRDLTERPGADVFVTLTRTATDPKDLPFNAQAVKPGTFRIYDAQNAGDAVARLTSVSISQQGRLGTTRLAGIRGATSNQTLVLIDGRPVGGVGLSASQDLAEIPVEQIDRIEVVRGGVSALYGPNAIGGVINVITKRATYPGTPASLISFETRSFGGQAYRLNFGSRYGPVDYFFFGNRQTESGFRDNSDARQHNIGGNIGVAMGGAGKLLLDIATYHANAGLPGQLFPDLPVNQYDNHIEKQASTPDARQTTDSEYIRTSYLLPLPQNSLATLRLFGSQRQVEFEIPSFLVDTDRHESSKGGEAQFSLPLGFLVGGTFIHDRLDSNDFVTPANHYIARVENWGLFAQETFKWKALTLIPSGRYDHNSVVGESKNPRVQLLADATDWLRFSASAGRSFRAPTIDDLYTPFTDFGFGFSYQGNPNLRPEKAWTYDAGFEVGAGSSTVRLGYFRANITDLIQTTPDLASTSINVGKARRQGMEVDLTQALGDRFRHSLNYTYLDNRGKPQGFDDYVLLRLSPRHTANYLATVFLGKRWSLDNTLRYVGAQYEGNNASGAKIGDHLTWGLRAAYQLRQMELFLGVENVTNKRYQERSGYPLPGITAYGGLSLRLWG